VGARAVVLENEQSEKLWFDVMNRYIWAQLSHVFREFFQE
jgi:hypothetical protein